jgi:single-stranded DNA-binding protein
MNNYTAIVNLTADVEDLTLGERDVKKLRVADNTFGKNSKTRFFDIIVSSGPDIAVASRLAKGDQIVVTGTLVAGEYTAKKNSKYAKKGQKVQTDSMPFGRILQVTKSPTFFNQDDEVPPVDDEGGEPEGSTEEPELNDAPDDGGSDPLEGVV